MDSYLVPAHLRRPSASAGRLPRNDVIASPRRGRRNLGARDRLRNLTSSEFDNVYKAKRVWIVTDSVFSMDGDLAPLPELVKLKNRYGAYLVLDEAHATGVYGPLGRGVSEHFGVSDKIDVHIGTLSKAVGAFGGFVAGTNELIEYLINHARPFIFETALPSTICAAAISAFDLIAEEPELRWRLWENVWRLTSGLKEIGAPILEGESPIIPVVLGEEKRTLEASEFLLEKGFLIPAVRYPTVAKGKARLRVTVSSLHTEDEMERLISAFKGIV